MIHTVRGFSIVSEAEVDVFLGFPHFLYDPMNARNLMSGSFAFSKLSLYVWKFSVGVALLDWNNWPFPDLWPLLSFPNCWHIEGSNLTASSFRIWNSSAGVPSPPLALFIVMLPKAHLTSHSRMSDSRWVTTSSLSRSLRSFLYT